MSDLHERLRATLAELHGELEQLGSADPQARELLAMAMEEIRVKLAAQSDEVGESQPAGQLTGQLAESARRFEATHPTLSRVLDNLIDMLAQMGI